MLIKSKLYNEVKEQDDDVKIHDYIKRINNNKLNDFTLDIVINIITNNIIKKLYNIVNARYNKNQDILSYFVNLQWCKYFVFLLDFVL